MFGACNTSTVCGKSQKYRDAHGHLLAGVGGQVKHTDAQEGDENARYDEVHRVEQSLAADLEREGDPCMAVPVAPRHHLVASRARYDIPRSTAHVVAQVYLLLTFVPVKVKVIVFQLLPMPKIQRCSVLKSKHRAYSCDNTSTRIQSIFEHAATT